MWSSSFLENSLWTWPMLEIMAITCQPSCTTPTRDFPVNQVRGACLNVDITAQAGNAACTGQTPVTAPYAGFSGTVSQALRPFPQYGNADVDTVTMGDPAGVYTYHALQVTAKKSISAGLTLLASYAWQKTLTNSDSEYPPWRVGSPMATVAR